MRGTGIDLKLAAEEKEKEHASLECLVHMGMTDCSEAKKPSEEIHDFVIVIPTLNEAAGIETTIDEIRAALEGMLFEILVVDGHSDDGTDSIASRKGAIVIYQEGRGYGNALRTGFLHARRNSKPKATVTIDADSSYDPRDIPSLLEPILSDRADLVIGNRFPGLQRRVMPIVNIAGNKMLSWMARVVLRLGLHDTQCGLRAVRTGLVDQMSMAAEGMSFATEMIAEISSAGGRIIEVPVAYRERIGDSKLRLLRDGLRIFGTILRLARERPGRRQVRTKRRGEEAT